MTERIQRSLFMAFVALCGTLAGCGERSGKTIDTATLAQDANADEWPAYGRTYREQRYGISDQINDGNVQRLGVDWSLDLPGEVGLVSTPLMSGGRLYFTTSRNNVYAVDARTGKQVWFWDPDVAGKSGDTMRFTATHGGRGVALWQGKVFSATSDGRLVALDAATGKEVWSVRTYEKGKPLMLTSAPKVFAGRVIIGNAGSEIGHNRGYVTAYDGATGKQLWRFHVVPGNPKDGFENKAMEMAAKTWTGEWWKFGGGGQVWGEGYTYDPEFNTIYVGTGNGTPWNRAIRSPQGGDNLFLSSIVALDADTGAYKWHYQATPADQWDFDSNSQMILADLTIDGRVVKALMQAPKNGFFYVIDRANGKLVSAKPYSEVTWAKGVDMKTGRPIENPEADYRDRDATVFPTNWGAHSWQPISYNPKTGLVYFPNIHESITYTTKGLDLEYWKNPPKFDGYLHYTHGINYIPSTGGYGTLTAYDPVRQKKVWEVPTPGIWGPGTLSTAGNLVFQGNTDGELVAYNAANGAVLWRYSLGLGVAAPPITYTLDGKQYVALLVGWGSAWAMRGEGAAALGWPYRAQTRRLVVFSLDATGTLAPLVPRGAVKPIAGSGFKVNPGLADKGAQLFGNCDSCHGGEAISGGIAPDLRASPVVLSEEGFRAVLRDGVRRPLGMPSFAGLSDQQYLELRHYIRQQAEISIEKAAAH